MLKASLIIPMPPNSSASAATGETKPLVGLYPCLGDDCGEYALVMIDNYGLPYVACSAKNITVKGCKRRAYGDKSDIPVQTFENYQTRFDFVSQNFPMSEPYRQFLVSSWEPYASDLPETIEEGDHDDG